LDPKFITPAIDLLRKVNFPGQSNVAVNIFKSGTHFKAYVSDKDIPTEGNNIWVIVRGNELENVVFTRDGGIPQNTQYQTNIAKIRRMVDEKGSYDLTYADLDGKSTQPKETRKRGGEMDLPVVIIAGKPWYADEKRELFFYTKNVNKVMSFDDAFSTLSEPELDGILDQLATFKTS